MRHVQWDFNVVVSWIRILFVTCVLLLLFLNCTESHEQHSPSSSSAVTLWHNYNLNHIFLAITLDGTIHAIDAESSTRRWSLSSGSPLISYTAISDPQDPFQERNGDDNTDITPPVVPAVNGSLFAIDIDQSTLHRLPFSVPDLSSLTPFRAPDGSLLVSTRSTSITAIDISSGVIIDSFHPWHPSNLNSNHKKDHELYHNQTNNIRDSSSAASSFNMQDDTTAYYTSSNSDSDSILHIARTDHTIHALSPSSHAVLWSMNFAEIHPDTTRVSPARHTEAVATTDTALFLFHSQRQQTHPIHLHSPIVSVFRPHPSSDAAASHHRQQRSPHDPSSPFAGPLSVVSTVITTTQQYSSSGEPSPTTYLGRAPHGALFVIDGAVPDTALTAHSPALLSDPNASSEHHDSDRRNLLPARSIADTWPQIWDIDRQLSKCPWDWDASWNHKIDYGSGFQGRSRPRPNDDEDDEAGEGEGEEEEGKSRLPRLLPEGTGSKGAVYFGLGVLSAVVMFGIMGGLVAVTYILPYRWERREKEKEKEKEKQTHAGEEEERQTPPWIDGDITSTGSQQGAENDDVFGQIKRLVIHEDRILGYGSHGTVVFEGMFDGRRVAVKRILADFYEIAEKEISLLIESDEHANVVRYFGMERDKQFIYLSLELCPRSLADYISHDTSLKISNPFEMRSMKRRIVRQLLAAVEHLHGLNIVHRDLKPQNVLMNGHNDIKLSDMGLGKMLATDQTSFETSAESISGSIGWQPREVILSGSRRTRTVDIFSLGCVIYYILSNGEHPFGTRFEREKNILQGKYSLDHIASDALAQDLVAKMIATNPERRIHARDAKAHPYFWSEEEKLGFLGNVSDQLGKEKDKSIVYQKLEKQKKTLFCGDTTWAGRIDRVVLDNVERFRKYDHTSVVELLRLIRNIGNHYREYDAEMQKLMQPLPGGIIPYFTASHRFPRIFIVMYSLVEKHWCDHDLFSRYFR